MKAAKTWSCCRMVWDSWVNWVGLPPSSRSAVRTSLRPSMPPWALTMAKYAWRPGMKAEKSPAPGPVFVEMAPTLICVEVTPGAVPEWSVAPVGVPVDEVEHATRRAPAPRATADDRRTRRRRDRYPLGVSPQLIGGSPSESHERIARIFARSAGPQGRTSPDDTEYRSPGAA